MVRPAAIPGPCAALLAPRPALAPTSRCLGWPSTLGEANLPGRVAEWFEVSEYFEHLRIVLVDLQRANQNLKFGVALPEVAERRTKLFAEVRDFYKKAPVLLGPYIQAHQKVGSFQ
jgi:hypothetical protein